MEFPHGFCLDPSDWHLPDGWTWSLVRTVVVTDVDVFTGWRLTLKHDKFPHIEVNHRVLEYARNIALDEARSLFPSAFGGFNPRKGM